MSTIKDDPGYHKRAHEFMAYLDGKVCKCMLDNGALVLETDDNDEPILVPKYGVVEIKLSKEEK